MDTRSRRSLQFLRQHRRKRHHPDRKLVPYAELGGVPGSFLIISAFNALGFDLPPP